MAYLRRWKNTWNCSLVRLCPRHMLPSALLVMCLEFNQFINFTYNSLSPSLVPVLFRYYYFNFFEAFPVNWNRNFVCVRSECGTISAKGDEWLTARWTDKEKTYIMWTDLRKYMRNGFGCFIWVGRRRQVIKIIAFGAARCARNLM